jgi:hypothetical protein
MNVIFKSINCKTYPYNVNPDDMIESIVEKLYVDANINKESHSFKIIFQGKILSLEQKFSEFTPSNPDPKEKTTFVFMVTKNKPICTNMQQNQTPIPTTIPTPSPLSQHQQNNQLTTIDNNSDDEYDEDMDNNNIDETDKLRASVIGMMVFIRAQPQLMELFNNNFEAFTQLILSPQFKPIFEAMNNNTSMGDENLDNLSNSIVSHRSNSNALQQTQTVSLSQDDINNITTLEALGFQKQACIQAYVLANKNVDMAASILMDM